MCSSTFTQQEGSTTSLARVAPSDGCSREKDEAEFHPLHMAWALTAGTKGNPTPRMHWLVD
jgi:hypothetical protein